MSLYFKDEMKEDKKLSEYLEPELKEEKEEIRGMKLSQYQYEGIGFTNT